MWVSNWKARMENKTRTELHMDIDELGEIAQKFATGLDLSRFNGDIVLNKHVEKELNVAAGGIGEQHIHYHGNPPRQDWPADLVRSQKTFKAKVSVGRLNNLFHLMVKFQLIAENSSPKDIIDVFKGEPSDCEIRWIAPEAALVYFINQLREKDYIDKSADDHWVIARNHFRDQDNGFFKKDMRKDAPPKKYKDQLDQLVEFLNPSLEALDEMSPEDFAARFDLYSKNGPRLTNRRH